jgi:hypothetical protein
MLCAPEVQLNRKWIFRVFQLFSGFFTPPSKAEVRMMNEKGGDCAPGLRA